MVTDALTSNPFVRVFHNVYKRSNTMICTPKQSILYPRNLLGQYYCFHHDARQIHYWQLHCFQALGPLHREEKRFDWVNSLPNIRILWNKSNVSCVSAFRQRLNASTRDMFGCWCLKKRLCRRQASEQKATTRNSLRNTESLQASLRGDRRLQVLFQFQLF